jgi:hypothetical protein
VEVGAGSIAYAVAAVEYNLHDIVGNLRIIAFWAPPRHPMTHGSEGYPLKRVEGQPNLHNDNPRLIGGAITWRCVPNVSAAQPSSPIKGTPLYAATNAPSARVVQPTWTMSVRIAEGSW